MIRSLLIALDGSAASQVATEFAIQSINERKEQGQEILPLLTGMAVVDKQTITQPQGVPIGGAAFKGKRDEALLAKANTKARTILENFKSACEEAQIEHDLLQAEGQPYEAIASASQVHDAIFIGRDTNFQFQTDDPCETVKRLIRDHPRPVIVTPKTMPEGTNVVVAYDGSRAASRALFTFAMTKPVRPVHVVSVDRNQARAEKHAAEAVEFLRRHDIQAQSHAITTSGSPTQPILDSAGQLATRLVVMGAYGHQGLQTWFFGSTTRTLLDKCLFPLFVY